MSNLSKSTISQLPSSISIQQSMAPAPSNHIVHIGVGGFHRSHQAFAIAKLLALDPAAYAAWRITAVGLMPTDKTLVADLRAQDHLYVLRTVAADQSEELSVINAIASILHGETDAPEIVGKIADPNTKLISFTITEGGYNYDFKKQRFLLDNTLIQHDLLPENTPKTVFGFLARGLQRRCNHGYAGLTLLSCDNIIGNGEVLKNAVLTFLSAYDSTLYAWAKQHLDFPNSMVDRITPIPHERDKEAFASRYGLRDNCLVVAEDYFQWVIEKSVGDENFPALEKVGVEFVEQVSLYEEMKLGILNAGHTLVGLLGDLLGYQTIHESVMDVDIAETFRQFCLQEVIPVLAPLDAVDYSLYFERVSTRFSNAMINDSTARIISASSDKFPKFVLPTILKQLRSQDVQLKYAAVIIAAWWAYLTKEMRRNKMQDVQDPLRDEFLVIFADEQQSVTQFLAYKPIFDALAQQQVFVEAYRSSVDAFQQGSIRAHLQSLHQNR